MKIDIDWNEAPDWAVAVVKNCAEELVWVPCLGGACSGQWLETGRNYLINMRHPSGWKLVQERPKTWTGEGLPPVGTVCEFQGDCAKCPSDPWHKELHDGVKCTVIAHFKSKNLDLVAFTFVKADGNSELEQALPGALRPIRTPEQIAEQKRKIEALKMFNIFCEANNLTGADMKGFYALYDAGFLQQATND